MTPVSCDHVTFNYVDKKARGVGLNFWCHLSNMSNSIFHESIKWGITSSVLFFFCFFLSYFFVVCIFCGVILLCSSELKRWTQFCHYNIIGRGEILNYNRIRQMGLISLQWDLSLKHVRGFRTMNSIVGGPFVFVWCVVFNQRYCIFNQGF